MTAETMPELIWALLVRSSARDGWRFRWWDVRPDHAPAGAVHYVRADLHDAAVARAEAAEAALAGARDKALREAEQMLAIHARSAVEIGSDEAGHTLWRAAQLVAALRAQPEKEGEP